MFEQLVLKNRSYRRFDNNYEIKTSQLHQLVKLGSLTPRGKNIQAFRFKLVNTKPECAKVYQTLGWAGYLTDWDGPEKNEQPTAYIIILSEKDKEKSLLQDEGIVAQTMLLAACEMDLGGCYFLSVNRDELIRELKIDNKYSINCVLALGKPIEEVEIVPIHIEDDFKYYRDENQKHYVPKIMYEELIVE